MAKLFDPREQGANRNGLSQVVRALGYQLRELRAGWNGPLAGNASLDAAGANLPGAGARRTPGKLHGPRHLADQPHIIRPSTSERVAIAKHRHDWP